VDEALFEGFVTESGSVLWLVGADSPERAELVTLPAIQLAIDRLSATCQYVLIRLACVVQRTNPYRTGHQRPDLPDHLGIAAFTQGDQRCLDLFDKIGVDSGRVRLILNYSTTHLMDVDTAARILGRRPDFVVQRSESLDRAANLGGPSSRLTPAMYWSRISRR